MPGVKKQHRWDWPSLKLAWMKRALKGDPVSITDFCEEEAARLGRKMFESTRKKQTAGWRREMVARRTAILEKDLKAAEIDQLKTRVRVLERAHALEPMIAQLILLHSDNLAAQLELPQEQRDLTLIPKLSELARITKVYYEGLQIGAGLPKVYQVHTEEASSEVAVSRQKQRELAEKAGSLRDYCERNGLTISDGSGDEPVN